MKNILKHFKIDETYTKATRLPKYFNKIKENIPLKKHMNYMADLLMLPETKEGYKHLLVVDDLATDNFDIEPLKTKEPKEVLEAFQKMFEREYIKKPEASVRTDGGTEFKGVFNKWLAENNIMHRVAEPDRHKQLANVERLNKELGRVFNGYMNMKEEETLGDYREWTDIEADVRKMLNEVRHKEEKDLYTYTYSVPKYQEPEFKVGDVVYHISEVPRNALGDEQPTKQFRTGDYRFNKILPRKITKVFLYSGKVPIRYMLEGKTNVSYAEYELKRAEKGAVSKYIIREILDDKIINKKKKYLVWWRGYLKEDATWEPAVDIDKDVPLLVKAYDKMKEEKAEAEKAEAEKAKPVKRKGRR